MRDEPTILPGTGRGTKTRSGLVEAALHARGAQPRAPSTIRLRCAAADGPPPRSGEELFASRAARLAGAAGVMFGWAPADFWAATPAELGALVDALRGDAGAEAIDGATLARLKEQFPDG